MLKLAIIYDKDCPKLTEFSYSSTYRDMFDAVCARFAKDSPVVHYCEGKDIHVQDDIADNTDVILIYDIHSSHHIQIDGLDKHPAVKYTYFNDPHQKEFKGQYIGGPKVHKLGAEQRVRRALLRGVDYIICPYNNGYFEHIAPYLSNPEDMLFWFPPAPSHKRFPLGPRPLSERKHKVLGNGILHDGGLGAYDFRKWAFAQPETYYIKHAIERSDVPRGQNYGDLLCQFSAALALCDCYVVPKYLEIPLAGCVCFAQDQEDYRKMGFKDLQNCFIVNRDNFQNRTNAFLNSLPGDLYYQKIANEGRKLISNKWTAECFAVALYDHAKSKGATNERQSRRYLHADVRTAGDTAVCTGNVR